MHQRMVEMELAALNRDETLTLAALIAEQPLPPALAQTLHHDTAGNPRLHCGDGARAKDADKRGCRR